MPCYGVDTVEGAVLWSGHCRGCRVMEGDTVKDSVLWSGHCRGCRVMEWTL